MPIPESFLYKPKEGVAIEVYEAEALRDFDPAFFTGLKKSVRKIVQMKAIGEYMHFYALKKKNGSWEPSGKASVKAKLLLAAVWARQHIPKLTKKGHARHEVDDEGADENQVAGPSGLQKEVIVAPDLLILDDKEKFMSEDGTPIELETRGERHPAKIFFKLSDVSKGFGIPNLRSTVFKLYQRGDDYVTFTFGTDNVHTDRIFFTYSGILRVLFTTRNGHTKRFMKWATEKLFVLQMGTGDEKQALVADVLGVPITAVKQVFHATITSVSCVYLFTLGCAGDLRASMGGILESVPDDWIVAKFGCTGDIERRATEHMADFKRIGKVSLKLKYCAFVDPTLASEAEVHIKEFFGNRVEWYDPKGKEKHLDGNELINNRHEIILISPASLQQTKKHFASLHSLFCGPSGELLRKIQSLHASLEAAKERHQLELAHKEEMLAHKTELFSIKEENLRMVLAEKSAKHELELEMKNLQLETQMVRLETTKEKFAVELQLARLNSRDVVVSAER